MEVAPWRIPFLSRWWMWHPDPVMLYCAILATQPVHNNGDSIHILFKMVDMVYPHHTTIYHTSDHEQLCVVMVI